jgi:hypothetical protein
MVKDAPLVMSTSHENVKVSGDVDFGNEYEYYQHTPIKDEGIFKPITNGIYRYKLISHCVVMELFHRVKF